ncbi:hypothetical protein OIO90_003337 [Microbotryomycetes sp. JL221]|nr:hypothetical protein OIO90_003337 [Microbotryomycetes sp. JL221]
MSSLLKRTVDQAALSSDEDEHDSTMDHDHSGSTAKRRQIVLDDKDDDDMTTTTTTTTRPQRERRAPQRFDNDQQDATPSSRAVEATRRVTAAALTKTRNNKGRAWEGEFLHTWDDVQEDEQGTLEAAVNGALINSKTRRILRDTSSIQRGIIRHVYLVIDLSTAMLEREFKSTWLDLTLQYCREFITEFFDQNPISQLAIVVTRDGQAERLTPLGGNPVDHLKVLQNKRKLEPRGEASLQNILSLAKSGLSHLPPHGSREVIIVLGSLTTCDPGNIHNTIKEVEKERIRVNIIGLSAEMKICRDIANQTKGTYNVARDDLFLRELLFEFVSPPPTLTQTQTLILNGVGPNNSNQSSTSSDLMLMGFPQLIQNNFSGICSCHVKLKHFGFECPRCKSRICDVPTECKVCSLTVVNAAQLARSYRHLFPVANYERVTQSVFEMNSFIVSNLIHLN